MEVKIPFGNEMKTVHITLPSDRVIIAQSKNPSGTRGWDEVVADAIRSPINVPPIHQQRLQGKKVVVITDDWGRPTPAWQVIPLILEQLHLAGAEDENITFITASGMHDPMSRAELVRKLGEEIVAKYRCISHDGGDWENLSYCGVTPQGTPIWVNKYVVEADYKIALGRIYLHDCYGYEGGYKMILPGVASFDTITRDHNFNFSSLCMEGNQDNPSRREADIVGKMVGIDFLINVVVNVASEPLKAFCGEPMAVHAQGTAWGDREVWGAEVGQPADITIISTGSGPAPAKYELETLHRAARVTREDGWIIGIAARDAEFQEYEGNERADKNFYTLPLDEFTNALSSLSTSELLRLHEKRDWPLSAREIQWKIKAVRSEQYRRRKIQYLMKRRIILTIDPDKSLKRVVAGFGSRTTEATQPIRIIIIPEGRTTLPKTKLL